MVDRLCALHDRLTAAGFAGAGACVALIIVSFWYEVVARYFFDAPTIWAYAIASYLLSPMIFLALPAMTRRGAHIAVSYVVDGLADRYRKPISRAVLLAAALVCLLGAWICAAETWRQYVREIETISAFPVQKWWISIFIPYGLVSSAFYFLRQLAGEAPAASAADGATS
jgi:TRAP-type C4-dicarboxylate transport system permease small subunit